MRFVFAEKSVFQILLFFFLLFVCLVFVNYKETNRLIDALIPGHVSLKQNLPKISSGCRLLIDLVWLRPTCILQPTAHRGAIWLVSHLSAFFLLSLNEELPIYS